MSFRFAVAAALVAGAAAAEPAAVIRLTPSQIAAIQAEADARPPAAVAAPDRAKRHIHREVEMSIGTGAVAAA